MASRVVLDAALPSLASLTLHDTNSSVKLAGAALHLPQLTWLRLRSMDTVRMRCSALPALARLQISSGVGIKADGFSCLQQLTHLTIDGGSPLVKSAANLLKDGTPASLRSLRTIGYPRWNDRLQRLAAEAMAAATQLTRLEVNGMQCLDHLAAWPHLRELLLDSVYPTNIGGDQLALLSTAPNVQALKFRYHIYRPIDHDEARRRQREIQAALPGCQVD
ncbi:hypothetical protein ABPG75_013052 [Micractinium tetrahymenae]